MRTKEKFFGAVKKAACLALAFAMAVTFVNPMTAEAKAKKVKLGNSKFLTTASTAAGAGFKSIGKGTTTLTFKFKKSSYEGYVKFTAPQTKNYKITIDKAKCSSGNYFCGAVCFQKVDPKYDSLDFVDVNTSHSDKIWFNYANKKSSGKYKNVYVTKRKGSVYLEAGQTYYIYTHGNGGYRSKSGSFNITIK